MSTKSISRRNLILVGALATAAGVLARAAGAPLTPVAPDDPTAKALGYVEDAKKVDLAKFPQKAAPGGATQKCSNCSLYTAVDAKQGHCAIFAGKVVKGGGWCNAWNKKA